LNLINSVDKEHEVQTTNDCKKEPSIASMQ